MGGIFGKDKKPASRITEQDEAILVREKLCINEFIRKVSSVLLSSKTPLFHTEIEEAERSTTPISEKD